MILAERYAFGHRFLVDFKLCCDVIVAEAEGFELFDLGGEEAVDGSGFVAGDFEGEGDGSNWLQPPPHSNFLGRLGH